MGWGWGRGGGGLLTGDPSAPFTSGDRPVRLGGVVQRRHTWVETGEKQYDGALCRWGLPPSPGVNPGTGGTRDVLGRPALLQVGCHRAAVDEFGCGTEQAPALLVLQRQASDAQWESQIG